MLDWLLSDEGTHLSGNILAGNIKFNKVE